MEVLSIFVTFKTCVFIMLHYFSDYVTVLPIQYNIFISPFSSHLNTERKRKQKIKHAENCASLYLSLFVPIRGTLFQR